MMLKRDEVLKLVRVVAETREVEIGCDECFERLDSFAETELSGIEASAAMPLVSLRCEMPIKAGKPPVGSFHPTA